MVRAQVDQSGEALWSRVQRRFGIVHDEVRGQVSQSMAGLASTPADLRQEVSTFIC